MSNILHRLIGRANGEAQGGLRPRLPSRFEAGLRGGGFTEIHAETLAASAEPPQSEPSAQSRPASDRAQTDHPPTTLQPPTPDTPPNNEPPPAPHREEMPQAAPSPPRAEQQPAPAPAPLLPVELKRTGIPSAILPELSGPVRPAEVEGSPLIDPGISPFIAPEPLLPPEKSARLIQVLTTGLASQPPVAAPDTLYTTSPQAQPEITIHIGRLDIRSDAPKAAASPRRAAAPRGLPGLSDYLRGGQS